jgi:single-strand DNA-binding protein
MASYTQTIAVGNLGKDPETRHMQNGDAVCNFSVAVTEKWKDKSGEAREETTWYPVNAFGKLAEICGQYLKKGSAVMVVGKMRERKWIDKESGQERRSWELRADTMQMLGGRSEGQRSEQSSKPAQKHEQAKKQADPFDDFEDSIPF